MKAIKQERFAPSNSEINSEFFSRLDRLFSRLTELSRYTPTVVREFIDTTAGSVVRNLPNGLISDDKDYYYAKVDATANTVTINPFSPQTIYGLSSLTLSARGDAVLLAFDSKSQAWYKV